MTVDDQDFKEFCQLMMDVKRNRILKGYTVGSTTETFGNQVSLLSHLGVKWMDGDFMQYSRYSYAFRSAEGVPAEYRGMIIIYKTDGIHPGYVRLIMQGSEKEMLHYLSLKQGTFRLEKIIPVRHGPAGQLNMQIIDAHLGFSFQAMNPFGCINDADVVWAIHSPYWAEEANEWIYRRRSKGSYTQNVIRNVVSYGCDFVCKPHKGYIDLDKDHEWRFSFSIAELILIRNWSTPQKAMYSTIRILHKMSMKNDRSSHLCTYYYKILMLWTVESNQEYFWEIKNLYDSIISILHHMIRSLKTRYLPHYFIPENNLFDCILSEDVTEDINAIMEICAQKDQIVNVLNSCLDEAIMSANVKFLFTMPSPFWRSFKLHSSLTYFSKIEEDIFGQKMNDHLYVLSSIELHKAYTLTRKSLCDNTLKINFMTHYKTHLTWTNDEDESASGEVQFSNSPQHSSYFCFGMRELENFFLSLLISVAFLEITDYQTWLGLFKSLFPSSVKSHSTIFLFKKLVVYSRCERMMLNYTGLQPPSNYSSLKSNSNKETENNDTQGLFLTMCSYYPTASPWEYVAFYLKEVPGRFPTVPISWFINKAYTANHYYALLSDYKATMEICEEIINAYKASVCNQIFAETGFPLLLSTKWIEIYDSKLQQMLGLSALCKFVIHGSDNRPTHIPVCPVQFAFYLRNRCLLDADIVSYKKFKKGLSIDDNLQRNVSAKLAKFAEEFSHHTYNVWKEISFLCGDVILNSATKLHSFESLIILLIENLALD